jgi:hypothetical protein
MRIESRAEVLFGREGGWVNYGTSPAPWLRRSQFWLSQIFTAQITKS